MAKLYSTVRGLTAWSFHNGFLAIGNAASGDRSLVALDREHVKTTELMPLSAKFYGGLSEGPKFAVVALEQQRRRRIVSERPECERPDLQPLAYLGGGFTGGLAFDVGDGQFTPSSTRPTAPRSTPSTARPTRPASAPSRRTLTPASPMRAANVLRHGRRADGKSKLYRIDLIGMCAGLHFSYPRPRHWAPDSREVWRSPSIRCVRMFGLLGGLVGLSSRANGRPSSYAFRGPEASSRRPTRYQTSTTGLRSSAPTPCRRRDPDGYG